MNDLIKTLQYIQGYLQAIQNGMDKFVAAAPSFVQQEINAQAKKKFNSTRQQYMDAVKVGVNGSLLVVELDREDWLANALESGIGQFNMKDGHLKSAKAKKNKRGYRYLVIPIGKEKGANSPEKSHTATRDLSQGNQYQKKINEALMKPKVGLSKLKVLMSGKVIESQKILTDDPSLQGFYRTRMFDSIEQYHSKKVRPQWQHVLFRTMSEDPSAKSSWDHPGITPANIFKATEFWIDQQLPKLLESFIEMEVAAINAKVGG